MGLVTLDGVWEVVHALLVHFGLFWSFGYKYRLAGGDRDTFVQICKLDLEAETSELSPNTIISQEAVLDEYRNACTVNSISTDSSPRVASISREQCSA